MEFADRHSTLLVEYTPEMILRKACTEFDIIDPAFWMLWADAEAKSGNIGDVRAERSAVWIYKKAIERQDNCSKSWLKWADFFDQYYSSIQRKDIDDALEIMHTYALGNNTNHSVWLAWAKMKELVGEIGDYSTKYSAAWIYKEYCQMRDNTSGGDFLAWVKFANRHPMHDGDRYIDAFYLLDYGEREYESFSNPDWLELEEFKKSIGYRKE